MTADSEWTGSQIRRAIEPARAAVPATSTMPYIATVPMPTAAGSVRRSPGDECTGPPDTGEGIETDGHDVADEEDDGGSSEGHVRAQDGLGTRCPANDPPRMAKPNPDRDEGAQREIGTDAEAAGQDPREHPVMEHARSPVAANEIAEPDGPREHPSGPADVRQTIV